MKKSRFEVENVAIEMVKELRPVLEVVGRHDAKLADQLRRAGTSVALNIGEGNYRAGGDKVRFFNYARGSVNELKVGLRVAVAWGYVAYESVMNLVDFVDQLGAMLYTLTHPRA